MIKRKELIEKYLKFFKGKGHKEIPNFSLIPENDPTVLFTTAGMHPLVPFLLGQRHVMGKRLVNVQKCIRTTDINEIGDETHHTFFEMLGNWSLGDYFKKEAIEYSFEFLTKVLEIKTEKLAVSVFKGDKNAPKDDESAKIWQSLGVKKERITPLGKEDNWWGPAGETGPCGPDTEMFYWVDKKTKPPEKFNPNDSTLATGGNKWVEIWNDVFMQYEKTKGGKFISLKQKNVDTGMGVERMLAVLNGIEDNYMTEAFLPIIKKIERLSGRKYESNKKEMRIIADHIKASVFIIADGITPSNTERGYVLRRLIRRAIAYGKKLGLEKNFINEISEGVYEIYKDYKELTKNKKEIQKAIKDEEEKFEKTLEKGMKKLKEISWKTDLSKKISGKDAFLLYQSYGFPIELTEELAMADNGMDVDIKEFEKELKKHQELSRTATKGKFRAGLADNSEQTTKYHTATHMLHKALKEILGKDVQQMGSNITKERLRFDFNFPRKLTGDEIKKIEDLVNKEIKKNHKVDFVEMPYEKAIKSGALSYFRERYPPIVKVYNVGDFSKEICTGPHVKNTKGMGKFRITKEESSSAGVRRIKAILE